MLGLDRKLWDEARAAALDRDRGRCTVSRLLGGRCRGSLHVHHIDPDGESYALDNLGTACAAHHPRWEALRRAILLDRERDEPRCPHSHRSAEARRICESQLARRRLRSAAA